MAYATSNSAWCSRAWAQEDALLAIDEPGFVKRGKKGVLVKR